LKQHEVWLNKARNDLLSANKLIAGEEPVIDTAVYHTHQCAEKSLKAFLAFKNKAIIRTHDLITLVDICVELNPDFTKLYELAEELNPYSILFRYTAEIMEPDMSEALDAIQKAKQVLDFVIRKLAN